MKFKLSIITLIIFLSLGFGTLSNSVLAESTSNPSDYVDNDIAAVAGHPISKKDIALRFILAMIGVAASSVVVYVGLSFYNKFTTGTPFKSSKKSNLRTPENFKEAINSFLDKTDWD